MPARKLYDKRRTIASVQSPRLDHAAPIDVKQLRGHENTAHRLLVDINAKRLDPATLDKDARKALLAVMAHGRMTSAELAKFFDVRPATIRKDIQEIRQELGTEIRLWTPEQLVGQLASYAERCTAALIKDGDWSAAWTIQRDFVRAMKELGFQGGDAGQDGQARITIEVLTENTSRARMAMLEALDPHLTGEVIDTTVTVKPSAPGLPLDMVRPDAPAQDPGIEFAAQPDLQGDMDPDGSMDMDGDTGPE